MIKHEACLELANYLRVNSSLKELALGGNKINNEGVMYLSQMLRENTTLEFLDLSRNQFQDQGFDMFA